VNPGRHDDHASVDMHVSARALVIARAIPWINPAGTPSLCGLALEHSNFASSRAADDPGRNTHVTDAPEQCPKR